MIHFTSDQIVMDILPTHVLPSSFALSTVIFISLRHMFALIETELQLMIILFIDTCIECMSYDSFSYHTKQCH